MEVTVLLLCILVAWWPLPGRFDPRVLPRRPVLGGAALVRMMRGER